MNNTEEPKKLSKRRLKFLDKFFTYKSLKHRYSLRKSCCKAIVVFIIRGRNTELLEGLLKSTNSDIEKYKSDLNL